MNVQSTELELDIVRELINVEDLLRHRRLLDGFEKINGVFFGPSPIPERHSTDWMKVGLSGRRWYAFSSLDWSAGFGGGVLELEHLFTGDDQWTNALRLIREFGLEGEYQALAERGEGLFPLTSLDAELDPSHQSVRLAGLNGCVLKYLRGGYCQEGKFRDRIVIPIHDFHGRLHSYAGYGRKGGGRPAWLFKSPWGISDSPLGIAQDVGLFNLHRAINSDQYRSSGEVMVVMNILDVARLIQCGIKNVVATMGMRKLTHKQLSQVTFCTNEIL